MKTTLISATDKNFGIGKDGNQLFFIPEDLKMFKSYTLNNIVLMGRKTYESIGAKPLPNRINIVISSSKKYEKDGILLFGDLSTAVEYCKENFKEKDLYIIGGGQIYKESLKLADEIILTIYDKIYEADTYFPEVDDKDFVVSDTIMRGEYEGVKFRTHRLIRMYENPRRAGIDLKSKHMLL